MKNAYVPIRKCICCQKKLPKSELVRIVKKGEDFFSDRPGTMNGRGAYVCRSSECISVLEKRNAVARAFRTKVTGTQYQTLTEELINL